MTSKTANDPPIPYTAIRRRLIDNHCYFKQPGDDLLLICTSLWTRLIAGIVTLAVCCFCVPFVMALYSSWTIENYHIAPYGTLFGWLAIAVMLGLLVHLIFFLSLSPIRFDRNRGTVGRGGWVPGQWERELTDVLAIQICLGKAEVTYGERARQDKIELQYELNLVFHDSPPTRHNLCQLGNLRRVERFAREIAKFLDRPILNYVGYTPGKPGTLKKANAEAQRLLVTRQL